MNLVLGGIYYTSNGGVTTPTWTKSNAPNGVAYWNGITSSANGVYLAACTDGNYMIILSLFYISLCIYSTFCRLHHRYYIM